MERQTYRSKPKGIVYRHFIDFNMIFIHIFLEMEYKMYIEDDQITDNSNNILTGDKLLKKAIIDNIELTIQV